MIGGGDWAADRIVPDAMRALAAGEPIAVRNPAATRPWQHVLEPLGGYLRLAEALAIDPYPPCEAFNFGPHLESNQPVSKLVASMLSHWPGEWIDQSDPDAPHEAGLLHLQIDKAHHRLGWQLLAGIRLFTRVLALWIVALLICPPIKLLPIDDHILSLLP